MKYLILLFGGLITFAGLAITVSPQPVLSLLDRYKQHVALYVLAVGVRLLLGAILIVYAPQSAFPLVLRIIGIVSIAAALGILLIGPGRLQRLIDYLLAKAGTIIRPAGVIGILLGAFLIYAVY
ncbi:MAG: hypothetical protein HKN77_01105 [Woeseiaceae bacterium]|nr:hypothetical protein [Woeseiaceae bacterium]